MNVDFLEYYVSLFSEKLWGVPLVLFIVVSSVIFSFFFGFIQIKKFIIGWKLIFQKNEDKKTSENSISTFQAFVNALSSSLGNGGLGGMATVFVEGGPGTVFWVLILGFFSMILRFVEVYAGLVLKSENKELVGPLSYIKNLPFGKIWVYCYSLIMLIYVFCAGISMQCNTMGLAVSKMTNFSNFSIGIFFALFVLYIIIGGSKRIMKVAEIIIPIKVGLFFAGIITLLIYHYKNIPDAIRLVLDNAFTIDSLAKGSTVFTMQKAITSGFSRALNATEAGVGVASVFFGSTEAKSPLKSAIMSMITAFISTDLVCAMLLFGLVVSGVTSGGLTSASLVVKAFETVFGYLAVPGITFLSFSFGLGVMVAYSFLGYKMWEFLFGKRTFLI